MKFERPVAVSMTICETNEMHLWNDKTSRSLNSFPVSKNVYLVMYGFWHDYVKPKYGEKQNYVTWIQAAL